MALNKTQHFDMAPRQDFGIHQQRVIRGPGEHKGGGGGVEGRGVVNLQGVLCDKVGQVRRQGADVFKAGVDRKNSQGSVAHRLPGIPEVYKVGRKDVKGIFRNPKNRRG